MAHRWTGSHAFRDHANDRVIDPGEELPEDIADDVVSAHPYDVEEIDEEDEGATDGDDDAGPHDFVVEPPFDPTEKTVDELEEALADVDDIDELEALADAESVGEDRTTALEAIRDRIAAVEE